MNAHCGGEDARIYHCVVMNGHKLYLVGGLIKLILEGMVNFLIYDVYILFLIEEGCHILLLVLGRPPCPYVMLILGW